MRPCATLTGSTSPIRSPTRGVRRGQLLGVAVVAVAPGDRQVVAELGGQRAAADADRRVRVVVDLAAGDLGAPLVEQPDQRAHQPGLALAALAEQHEVVAGQQCGLQLGQHRVVEADDAGEGGRAGPQPVEQIGSELLLGAAWLISGCPELAEGGGPGVRGLVHVLRLRRGRRPTRASRTWWAGQSRLSQTNTAFTPRKGSRPNRCAPRDWWD